MIATASRFLVKANLANGSKITSAVTQSTNDGFHNVCHYDFWGD
jgi:hypothetical protein